GGVVRAAGCGPRDARPLDPRARAAPARPPRITARGPHDLAAVPSRHGQPGHLPAAGTGRRVRDLWAMRRGTMDKPERILGNVATRLLLENERVRIWEMDLAPGTRSDTHRHQV